MEKTGIGQGLNSTTRCTEADPAAVASEETRMCTTIRFPGWSLAGRAEGGTMVHLFWNP